jgi:hypothetical protein
MPSTPERVGVEARRELVQFLLEVAGGEISHENPADIDPGRTIDEGP